MISGYVFKVIVGSAEQVHASTREGLRTDAVIAELQMH